MRIIVKQNIVSTQTDVFLFLRKMNVLKFNKVYLTILGIYPVNRISKSCVGSTRNTGFYFFLLSLSTLAGSSAAYMHRNFSDWSNLPSYTTALCVIVACFGNIGSFISINANRKHIEHVRAELQQIVNKGEVEEKSKMFRLIFALFYLKP